MQQFGLGRRKQSQYDDDYLDYMMDIWAIIDYYLDDEEVPMEVDIGKETSYAKLPITTFENQ